MRGAMSAAAAMSATVVAWKPRSREQPERGLDDLLARPLLLALSQAGVFMPTNSSLCAQSQQEQFCIHCNFAANVIPCKAWPMHLDVSPPRPRGIGNAPSRSSPRSSSPSARRPRPAAAPSSTASALPARSPSRRSTSSPSASRRSPATPRRWSSPPAQARSRATPRSRKTKQAVERQPHVTGVAPLQLCRDQTHRLPHRPVRQARAGPAARARRAARRRVERSASSAGLEVSRRGPIVDQAEQLSRARRRADRPRGGDASCSRSSSARSPRCC